MRLKKEPKKPMERMSVPDYIWVRPGEKISTLAKLYPDGTIVIGRPNSYARDIYILRHVPEPLPQYQKRIDEYQKKLAEYQAWYNANEEAIKAELKKRENLAKKAKINQLNKLKSEEAEIQARIRKIKQSL